MHGSLTLALCRPLLAALPLALTAPPTHAQASSLQNAPPATTPESLSACGPKNAVKPDKVATKWLNAKFQPVSQKLVAAHLYFNVGELVKAEVAAKEAIQLNTALLTRLGQSPRTNTGLSAYALEQIGAIRLEQGKYAEALHYFLAGKPRESWDDRTEVNVALCHLRLGNEAEARNLYDSQCLYGDAQGADVPSTESRQGPEVSILLSHGLIARNDGRYASALRDLKEAQLLAPGSAYLAYAIGRLLRQRERYADAKRWFEIAAKINRCAATSDAAMLARQMGYQAEMQQRAKSAPFAQ